MEKEILEGLIEQRLSTYQIADKLGRSQSGVYYWIKKYGLETNPKRGPGTAKGRESEIEDNPCKFCGKLTKRRNTFCGNTCYADHIAMPKIEEWENGDCSVLPKSTQKTGLFRSWARRYLVRSVDYRCEWCGWTANMKDDGLPPLETHHINGDYKDNRIENIAVICPNCHAVHHRNNPIKDGNGRWVNGGDSRNI